MENMSKEIEMMRQPPLGGTVIGLTVACGAPTATHGFHAYAEVPAGTETLAQADLGLASCAPGTGYATGTIKCEWEYTGDENYIQTGWQVNGRAIHTRHWFVTRSAKWQPRKWLSNTGAECWVTGLNRSHLPSNWDRDNWCQIILDGQVAEVTPKSWTPDLRVYCAAQPSR